MSRDELKERAAVDPAYAMILGMCHGDEIDEDHLCLALGRSIMAIMALGQNGWDITRLKAVVAEPEPKN